MVAMKTARGRNKGDEATISTTDPHLPQKAGVVVRGGEHTSKRENHVKGCRLWENQSMWESHAGDSWGIPS